MIQLRGSRVKPKRLVDIRTEANFLRNLFGASQPFFKVLHFLEFALPSVDPEFGLKILTKKEMGDDLGIAFPDKKLICLREDVYENADAGHGRDRFTVAHEIGHYWLHHAQHGYAQSTVPHKTFEDSEWQADAFAAELLMPLPIVQTFKHPYQLAHACGVSIKAAKVRFSKLRKHNLI